MRRPRTLFPAGHAPASAQTFALLLALAAALQGCHKKEDVGARPEAPMAAPARATSAMQQEAAADRAAGGNEAAQAPAARRYIAMRHDLVVQTDADGVEAAWRAAVKACEAAGCEILASSLARESPVEPARASLDARLPPGRLDGFLQQLGGLGAVGRHDTAAEDKTHAVVDTEARQKNLTELRDRLRQMLNTPGAKLSDLMEVEQTLARVQSELDTLSGLRKVLADETEKVRVMVSFEPRPSLTQHSTWQPLVHATEQAGYTLSSSLAALLSFVVAALPWVLLGIVALAGLRALRRRIKKRAD